MELLDTSIATPFRPLLEAYLARLPGADAVALVDCEGECVDQAGAVDDYELRIFAATLNVVAEAARLRAGDNWTRIVVGLPRTSFHLVQLAHAYCIVSRRTRAAFGFATPCADAAAISAISTEAGWKNSRDEWYPACVAIDSSGAPTAVGAANPQAALILGRQPVFDASSARFLVRLATGQELQVAREGFRHWYVDQKI